jgi:hypothetical protein
MFPKTRTFELLKYISIVKFKTLFHTWLDNCMTEAIVPVVQLDHGQGDQMELWKTYPKYSPTQFWYKDYMHNFYREKWP